MSQKIAGLPSVRVAVDAGVGCALSQLLARRARHRQSGDVALDVGHEHRHADPRESFGEDQQRDGLAGAGGTRDETVAVSRISPAGEPAGSLPKQNVAHGPPVDV